MSPGQGPLWGSERLLPPARAAAIHVAGELLFVAACWRLSVDLMPSGAPGEFQSVFAIVQATAQMLAPALMTTVVIGWARTGGSSSPRSSSSRRAHPLRPRAGRFAHVKGKEKSMAGAVLGT